MPRSDYDIIRISFYDAEVGTTFDRRFIAYYTINCCSTVMALLYAEEKLARFDFKSSFYYPCCLMIFINANPNPCQKKNKRKQDLMGKAA